MSLQVREDGTGVVFSVRVIPRARRSELDGVREGALVVRLAAPPVEGQANAALQAFLAELLGLRKGQVTLRTGEKSRSKVVHVEGLPAARIQALAGES